MRIFGLIFALLAVGCQRPAPGSMHYVNMGSSFAAGLTVDPPADGAPMRCGRSAKNYAQRLASKHRLDLDDMSCSGASTRHLLEPWQELPAQMDAVRQDTALVTMTVGGNDLNYVGNLIAASCDETDRLTYGGKLVPCPPLQAPKEEAYRTLKDNLYALADAIKVRAPKARIVFIQYLTLVPKRQCAQTRLTPGEAAMLRSIGVRLSSITYAAAKETGVEVLTMDSASQDHTPCSAEPWVAGFPKHLDVAKTAPWHPNAAGMKAIEAALDRLLADGL